MKSKMSIVGIGPKLVLMTVLYSILLVFFSDYSKYNYTVTEIPYSIMLVAGILLILIGVSLLVPSIIAISKIHKAENLCVYGVYSVCRHPLYAAWIIFIVPGILLLFNSWILLSIPLIMYVLFRILIRQEENYLQNKYGDQYINYKNRVSLLFPMFWKYNNKKE